MRNIIKKLIPLLKEGSCAPQIAALSKKLKIPAPTIHYNLKKMQQQGLIKSYRAIFNHALIEEGFCAMVLVNLSPDQYGDPEKISKDLARHAEIESVDICTGDWEIILKVRCKDQDAYYLFLKNVISRQGIIKIKTLISLKQIKH